MRCEFNTCGKEKKWKRRRIDLMDDHGAEEKGG